MSPSAARVCWSLVLCGWLPVSPAFAADAAPANWTVMQTGSGADPCVKVVERFDVLEGEIRCEPRAGELGYTLPKAFESTYADPATLRLGHSVEEIRASARDLLGEEILERPGDPDYATVAAVFAPIQKMSHGTYSFVGMPGTTSKVGFTYGGRSPDFDPATLQTSIEGVVKAGRVGNGLVGHCLPVLRFVYPESEGTWTEMITFAPPRIVNGNDRLQPVWYRVARIEGNALKWVRYFDTYQNFPPRDQDDPSMAPRFYADLHATFVYWHSVLEPAMRVSVPDVHFADLAKFGLIRALMTRQQGFPKYGAIDKDYGGSEHDGFPDTFTIETTAMIEWGLMPQARSNIENYLRYFLRDDGMIQYRGPETGQFGRMLTVLAQYVNAGGDAEVLLKYRARIDALTELLLRLRKKALSLPKGDPAYGLLSGWSEADASLDKDPTRYMQPYFANSTEAERGFRDLGRVWLKLGEQDKDDALAGRGRALIAESVALHLDVANGIKRSWLTIDGEKVLPSIAGVKEPFHIAVPKDNLDPQYRSYRAYMEMMFSGNLPPAVVNSVIDYRATHHDVLLGVPAVYGYNTGIMGGFLAYGHGYGLIQVDRIREALLMTYSHAAHQYTRGTWLAPETRWFYGDDPAAPYATPAQVVAPLMLKWLLVFEDPNADVLWLGKGVPRQWLKDGKRVYVGAAPTRWGRVGYTVNSSVDSGHIDAKVELPADGIAAEVRVRLRAPDVKKLKSVTVNGKPWKKFDAAGEFVSLPPGTKGTVEIIARY